MTKKAIIGLVILVFLSSIVFASPVKVPLVKDSGLVKDEGADSSSITGNIVFETKPNEIQKVYVKSIPAVVKIIVYVDFERFLPNIDYIDWSRYNNKIEWGEEPTADDVRFEYDLSTNYYDLTEEEWGSDYGSEVEDFPFSVGSGFIIHPEGFILTNAHVLPVREKDVKEMLKSYYLNVLYYGMEEAYAYDPEYTTDLYLDDWALLNFMTKKLEIRDLKIKTQVIVGVDKPREDLNARMYTPEIIDYELGDYDEELGIFESDELDWALIKIEGSNFPTLPLGDSDRPSIGSQIISVGYPFVSEEYEEEEEYEFKTNIEPTLTTGYISQITSIEGNKFFQVDLSISEGNSGGPALDKEGKVIGITTLGMGEYVGGHYNYVLRINDIYNKVHNYVVPAQSKVDQLWNSALESYWNQEAKQSRVYLRNVSRISPNHPYVQNILKIVDLEAGEEEEETYLEPDSPTPVEKEAPTNGYKTTIWIMGLVILALIIINQKKKLKKYLLPDIKKIARKLKALKSHKKKTQESTKPKVNEVVRERIMDDNLGKLGIGILMIIGGILLNIFVFSLGWIAYILIIIPIIGIGKFFEALYHLVYFPSNMIYQNWEHYGGGDKVINEVQAAIKNKKKTLDSEDFMISKGWIIKPSDFVFVKPKDVNWVYLSKEQTEGTSIQNQKIKIYTKMGIKFEVNCSSMEVPSEDDREAVTEDVVVFINILSHLCKDAIIGFHPDLESIWEDSPEDFLKESKKVKKNR
ncbi:serine protease [Candidatus Woesearchaeota archaeon]|nr:serine protease [Candidatus Woesearchaeota archaeon]